MINRRGFLKLLGMGLAAAGVSATTITTVFSQEEKRGERPDKMAVGEAIRKIVAREKVAGDHAGEALQIIAEAHRDFSLAWAAGAANLYMRLAGQSALPRLVRVARSKRKDPVIGTFLSALKRKLLKGTEKEGAVAQMEAAVAYGELAGLSQGESYASFMKHDTYVASWLSENEPKLLAEAFGQIQLRAAG